MFNKKPGNFHKFLFFGFLFLAVQFAGQVQAAANKNLLLLPVRLYADPAKAYLRDGIKTILTSRLAGYGLEIIKEESFVSFLNENEKMGITDRTRAEELAGKLDADYALFGSITSVGTGYSLDLSLLEIRAEGSRLERVSEAVEENKFIPRMAEVGRELRNIIEGKIAPRPSIAAQPPGAESRRAKGLFARLGREAAPADLEKGLVFRPTSGTRPIQPTGQISLRTSIAGFDLANLDGTGENELLAVDRKNLRVYQRRKNTFALQDTFKAGLGEDFLKVSAADADGDGKAEIYLVSRYGIRARTTVLQWAGDFRRIHRKTGHLQAVKTPGADRPLLLYRESKVGDFLGGDIHQMQYAGEGKITRGDKLPELEDVGFYSLSRYDLDQNGTPEWIGLGDESRLFVWDSEGKALWKGDRKLGGTNNAIRLGDSAPGEPAPRIAFNGRLVFIDIDDDNEDEVLVIKNIPLIDKLRDFVVFTKANLVAYEIEGTALNPAWATGDLPYSLADIQAEKGTLFLAGQKGKIIKVTKGSSRILWFE